LKLNFKTVMTPTQDIQNLDDIKKMVDTFYTNVRQDEAIGPVFNEKIGERWPEHLEKMYRFWQTILLEVHTYSGSPFPPHKQLPVDKTHFDRWMAIFTTTIDSLFAGPLADEAKLRAKNMAEMFNYKIEYFRKAEREQLK
jgi:hemoglobin